MTVIFNKDMRNIFLSVSCALNMKAHLIVVHKIFLSKVIQLFLEHGHIKELDCFLFRHKQRTAYTTNHLTGKLGCRGNEGLGFLWWGDDENMQNEIVVRAMQCCEYVKTSELCISNAWTFNYMNYISIWKTGANSEWMKEKCVCVCLNSEAEGRCMYSKPGQPAQISVKIQLKAHETRSSESDK